MGQITFKENGSIQFKGGKITFLSYVPMPDPTVTVQWVYESGQYKAKVTIINNHEYDAILNYTVTLGGTVETYDVTLTGSDVFTRSFYDSSNSPDNGFLFRVDAFCEDEWHERPNSATISKETTADFRVYIYNTGISGMQGLSQGYTYGNAATYSITPTVGYLEVTARSTSLYQSSVNAVRTTVAYYMSTDDAMIFEYTAQGSTDMDSFTFAETSNWNQDIAANSSLDKIVKVFSSSWTDGRVSLDSSEGYYIMQITSMDQPLDTNRVRIKKVYIESKEDGDIV